MSRLLACGAFLAGALLLPCASEAVDYTTLSSSGRTTLVLSSAADVRAAPVVQHEPRTVILNGTSADACEPVRLTDSSSEALVSMVSVACTDPHTFVATIVTTSDVSGSMRGSNRLLYIDLTRRTTPPSAAVATAALRDRVPTPVRAVADGPRRSVRAVEPEPAPAAAPPLPAAQDFYSRASALASAGRVRELNALIASDPPSPRDDARIEQLLDAAQTRRLALDRELFAREEKR